MRYELAIKYFDKFGELPSGGGGGGRWLKIGLVKIWIPCKDFCVVLV